MDDLPVINDKHWYCINPHVNVLLNLCEDFLCLLVTLEHILSTRDSSPLCRCK